MSSIHNSATLAGILAGRGVAYASPIAAAAARHGVDPILLAAVAAQETGGPGSDGGRNVVGDGGHGHGLFQIDDRWHAFARSPAAMDPAANADYAAGMLSNLLHKYGGNVRRALSAYNAGSPDATGTVTDWGRGRRLGYAESVLTHYRRLAGAPEALRAETPAALESVNALAAFAEPRRAAKPQPAAAAYDLGSLIYDSSKENEWETSSAAF